MSKKKEPIPSKAWLSNHNHCNIWYHSQFYLLFMYLENKIIICIVLQLIFPPVKLIHSAIICWAIAMSSFPGKKNRKCKGPGASNSIINIFSHFSAFRSFFYFSPLESTLYSPLQLQHNFTSLLLGGIRVVPKFILSRTIWRGNSCLQTLSHTTVLLVYWVWSSTPGRWSELPPCL